MGKKKKGMTCDNINYTDFQLRQITAHILGLEDFDEQVFSEQIEGITVLEDATSNTTFTKGGQRDGKECDNHSCHQEQVTPATPLILQEKRKVRSIRPASAQTTRNSKAAMKRRWTTTPPTSKAG